MKKKLTALLVVLLIASLFVACSNRVAPQQIELSYYDSLGTEYNTEMFYVNDLLANVPDPSCIYITEGDQAGYYYAYGTNSPAGFLSYRSKDLNFWEPMGPAYNIPNGIWGTTEIWAPEVVYMPEEETYYLYHSARITDKNCTDYNRPTEEEKEDGSVEKLEGKFAIGIATSKNPQGPFTAWTGTNGDGKAVTLSDVPLIDLSAEIKKLDSTNLERFNTYDVHVFMDGEDIYLYFSCSFGTTYESIWGMKMKDAVTPDYSTLTRLLVYGKKNINDESTDFPLDKEDITEGAFVIKNGSTYYLTYSTYSYESGMYNVCYATADSPLGGTNGYVKAEETQGNPMLVSEPHWQKHSSGTGHASFIKVGDELFMVYHAHKERVASTKPDRAIAVDRVLFMDDPNSDFAIPHVNGPTWSVQPLAEKISGYKNIAKQATVTATNIATDAKVDTLTDGAVAYHKNAAKYEFTANKSTVITLEFASAKEVSAIMIYNSYDYQKMFDKIDRIEFDLAEPVKNKDGNDFAGTAFIKDLKVNPKDVNLNTAKPYGYAGGSAVAEFAPIKVNKITITISSKYTQVDEDNNPSEILGVSDIVVLSKSV